MLEKSCCYEKQKIEAVVYPFFTEQQGRNKAWALITRKVIK